MTQVVRNRRRLVVEVDVDHEEPAAVLHRVVD